MQRRSGMLICVREFPCDARLPFFIFFSSFLFFFLQRHRWTQRTRACVSGSLILICKKCLSYIKILHSFLRGICAILFSTFARFVLPTFWKYTFVTRETLRCSASQRFIIRRRNTKVRIGGDLEIRKSFDLKSSFVQFISKIHENFLNWAPCVTRFAK